MALTITVAELAAAARVTASATTPPAEPQLSILHRQLRVAEALIEDYANAAPDDVKNEAAIRMVGYLYDAPPANPSRNVSTPESSFRNSGALALLSRWHSLEYARVDGPTDVPVSIPESNINPSHPVHPGTHYRYAGWSDNGMIDQAELDAAAQFTGDVLTVPNARNKRLLLLWRGRNAGLSRLHHPGRHPDESDSGVHRAARAAHAGD